MGTEFKPDLADNQQGFSIIEILIAMAILALAMLAAATMQLGSIRNNASGNTVYPAAYTTGPGGLSTVGRTPGALR